MLNGHLSQSFPVQRGVKQGDALSCALFVLAVDPLLRNIVADDRIKPFQLTHRNQNLGSIKVLAYADDITIITESNQECIQGIFSQYERLTDLSGLELNADKTEILDFIPQADRTYEINYLGSLHPIQTVNKIVICGIMLAHSPPVEYEYNVSRRISEMESQLKRWMCRNLTLRGKAIIAKTFGFSQLIYTAQCCEIKTEDCVSIERMYFKFLWSKKWESNAPDRIKRSILKQPILEGGLNCVDMQCLNEAIKLQQFFKAFHSNGLAHDVQNWILLLSNHSCESIHEFKHLSEVDSITTTAQDVINKITKFYRENSYGLDDFSVSSNMINHILGTNILLFAKRNNYPLLAQQALRMHVTDSNIQSLQDLLDSKVSVPAANNVFKMLPAYLRKVDDFYIPQTHSAFHGFLLEHGNSSFLSNCSTTQFLQLLLKNVNKKLSEFNVCAKHQIDAADDTLHDHNRRLYLNVKDPKLRNTRFRILHGDVYSKERMMRFGMSDDALCTRCGEVESTRHLLFDCIESKLFWRHYNELVRKAGWHDCTILNYDDVILSVPQDNKVTDTLKSLILKLQIQIERPMYSANFLNNAIQIQKHIEKFVNKHNVNYMADWNKL